ncbi:MAG: hypothetical protein ABFS24_15010 [Pseudomonadota bacterium]
MKKTYALLCTAILMFGMASFTVEAAKPVDNDGDGVTSNRDCNDDDPTVWELNSCGECAPEPPEGCGTCTPTPGEETQELTCDDTIDNDCDTYTDGDDSDCPTGGACSDYTDRGLCNDDPACEWQGNPNNGSCVDIPGGNRDVVVMATNDLGMHCACPGSEYMLLLPPFNTLRAQVIERGGKSPVVLSDPTDIRVEYDVLENHDVFNSYKPDDPSKTDLSTDFYYSTWMEMMPEYGFGLARVDDGGPNHGAIRGLTGAMLAGEMDAQVEGWWEVIGVPAFPDAHNSSNPEYIMVDPLGGPDRNPYLTGEVNVYEQSSGDLLASTTTTVPTSFGGCCSCHLALADATPGYTPDPESSFDLMADLHERDSGINFGDPAVLDPNNDGVPGPVRCSVCHWDPAMGETSPPGGYVNATTGEALPISQYSFSDVLHRWHVENTEVLSYNPDLATDCYECHPSNEVNCYRGHHTLKTLGQDNHAVWCTDCHGDLHERVAEGQLANPWSEATLPRCQDCHSATGENEVLHHTFGGSFLKSMSHKNDTILCSTCHGAPHALNPSTLAKDNIQNQALQGMDNPIGKCSVCHTNKKDGYSKPAH